MTAAVRAWISIAAALISGAAAQAQDRHHGSRLLPLPHPEILYPNEPNLPPRVLHPHVYHSPPHRLARHQRLLDLPHPELAHPRPQVPFGSGFIMTATRPSDASGAALARGPADRDSLVDNPRQVPEHIVACWNPPPLGSASSHQVTVRMEFKRDGSIFGKPLVTYVATNPGAEARQAMVESIETALRQCTPLHFSRDLGGAIAGYPFAIRFIQVHGPAPAPQH